MAEGVVGDPAREALHLAISEAYVKHNTAMHRVAYAVLYERGLQDEASDIVNTAILEVLDKPPTAVENWEAYLVTIVHRRALDFLRSASVRHRDNSDFDLALHPDDSDDIEEAGNNIDLLAQLAKAVDALNSLDPTLHRVAYEYFWMKRNQSDIADDLGITQARVSQIITIARKQMREHIEGGAQ